MRFYFISAENLVDLHKNYTTMSINLPKQMEDNDMNRGLVDNTKIAAQAVQGVIIGSLGFTIFSMIPLVAIYKMVI